MILASIAWNRKDKALAVEAFDQVLRIRPTQNEAFRGVFQCLWEEGRREEALERFKRFVRHCRDGSNAAIRREYMAIVNEINAHPVQPARHASNKSLERSRDG
jgi:regulator of sirC expression with transglutaminase-like and TPR domain